VQVREALTGKHQAVYLGHSARIRILAWSPRGDTIASSSDDNTIQIWHALTGNFHGERRLQSGQTLSWSPDGKHIASEASDSTVQVWYARE
jgi:WD40 repeat protein